MFGPLVDSEAGMTVSSNTDEFDPKEFVAVHMYNPLSFKETFSMVNSAPCMMVLSSDKCPSDLLHVTSGFG